ncbi:MAG: DUF2807 domain-containing protein, partial [Bacteroidales bacterium]|nr:DUF2807 domain-containing protein [Bacteroidales bacterium]
TAIILGAFILCSVIPANAIEKTYDNLKPFNSLEVSSVYEVKLTQGPNCSLKLDVNDEYFKYVIVEVKDNSLVLKINYSKMPVKMRAMKRQKLIAYVTMPSLQNLELSGMVQLEASGVFDQPDTDFDCEISGGSKVDGLSINARRADLELNGTTSIKMTGSWKSFSTEISGISKADISGNADKLEFEVNGSSTLNISGKYLDIKGEVTGESRININGSAINSTFDISGVSSVNASGLESENISVDISGVSKATVNPVKNLRLNVSGVSSVYYVDNDKLHINPLSISGAASVKAIK